MPTDRSPDHIAASISAKPTGFAGQPLGLSTLFFTEVWERFSYYGMRALLTLFIVAPIAGGGLGLGTMEAARIYGNYTMAVYMLSIPGGFIADRYLGALSLGPDRRQRSSPADTSRWRSRRVEAFYAGLALVALGTGLFKPNISAMVGRALRARR